MDTMKNMIWVLTLAVVALWASACDSELDEVEAPSFELELSRTEIDSGEQVFVTVVGSEDYKYVMWHGRHATTLGEKELKPKAVYEDKDVGLKITPSQPLQVFYDSVATFNIVVLATNVGTGRGNSKQTLKEAELKVNAVD